MGDLFKDFEEEFNKLDILEQIQFVFYYNSRIYISREQASSVLAYYLMHRGFKFFKDAILRANMKEGESDE